MSNLSTESQTERVSIFRSVEVAITLNRQRHCGLTEQVLTTHGGLGHVEFSIKLCFHLHVSILKANNFMQYIMKLRDSTVDENPKVSSIQVQF